MSAAARAEARRKAILARGNDRLAKLTTSARGDDAAYLSEANSDLSRPSLRTFVGDESPFMPKPTRLPSLSSSTPISSPIFTSPPQNSLSQAVRGAHPLTRSANRSTNEPFGNLGADPSVWSESQQAQLLRAFMEGASGGSLPGFPRLGSEPESRDGTPGPESDRGRGGYQRARTEPPQSMEDMMAGMMRGRSISQSGGGMPDIGPSPPTGDEGMDQLQALHQMFGGGGGAAAGPPRVPPTRLQKMMPLIHLVAMWGLLAYFVFWKTTAGTAGLGVDSTSASASVLWEKWAELGKKRDPVRGLGNVAAEVFGIEPVPFFWSFITLEIMLHSIRIFSGYDAIRPPTLLALALPHLPQPIPKIITHVLKYIQMGSLFLNDVAALLFGMGVLIYYSSWRV